VFLLVFDASESSKTMVLWTSPKEQGAPNGNSIIQKECTHTHMVVEVLFNIFASLALVSATMVIISGNPIHSVIFLILVFCNATGLLLLLKLEFLGMMFLIIYVGAIAVLFLFIVMMLNIKLNEINEN